MIIEITTAVPTVLGASYFFSSVRTWINGAPDGPYYFNEGISFLSSSSTLETFLCAEYSPSSYTFASYATLEIKNFLMMSGNERIMDSTNGKNIILF